MNHTAALKEFRKKKNVNQTTVASKLKMPLSTYSYKERVWDFSPDELDQILRILRITEVELNQAAMKHKDGKEIIADEGNEEKKSDYRDEVIALLKENADLKAQVTILREQLQGRLDDFEEKFASILSNQQNAAGYLLQIGKAVGVKEGKAVKSQS
jgi:transcriptional regulator with XRE-family HTH domain